VCSASAVRPLEALDETLEARGRPRLKTAAGFFSFEVSGSS
jgi:hypothetical protein